MRMNFPEVGRPPQILQTGLACVSSRPRFVSSCRPHLCKYTLGWLVPFYLQPPLWALPQDMVLSRGQPASSLPIACWTPCARRPPQSMEPWLDGQLSWRAGRWLGHTLVDQAALVLSAKGAVAMVAQSPARCVWPVRQLPGLDIR